MGKKYDFPPSSPEIKLGLVEKYNKELEELKDIDTSKMKNKQLEEHSEKIKKVEKIINDYKNFYKSEYLAIESIISSIKKVMAVNDDF